MKNWEEGLGNVNIFVNQMEVGDLVVVPDDNKKDVYFGKITSGYLYDGLVDIDSVGMGYPHQRKVDWYFNKKSLVRSELPEQLLTSLRYPGTIAAITKHYEVLLDVLDNKEVSSSNSLVKEQAIEVLQQLLQSDNEEIRLKAAEIIVKA